MKKKTGIVYLVGAGPGDPELITLKGLRLLKTADIIFYDHLVHKDLLTFARLSAQKIDVGKRHQGKACVQREIEDKIIREAKKGKRVVRLKGGDPFIFGRGGEEAMALYEARVPFEIVPGITSAIAVPAYAGIPLTHRDFSADVAFVTGHENPAKQKAQVSWHSVAGAGTVVLLMGVGNLRENLDKLIRFGKSPDTPSALISWGTTSHQKTAIGTLSTLADLVENAKMESPGIAVIGEVVSLHSKLEWLRFKNLFNKTIIVTRSREQNSRISQLLKEAGAIITEFPTIKVLPPLDFAPLDKAIKQIQSYDWLIFTSVNGVDYFLKRMEKKNKSSGGLDLRQLVHLKIGAIGSATASRLKEYGLWVDLLPPSFVAESLLKALKKSRIYGKKILIPRAKEGREVLIQGLRQMNCLVDVVEAYRSVCPKIAKKEINRIFFTENGKSSKPDWITFASSSTVDNFVKIVGKQNLQKIIKDVGCAVIGPITRKTALNHGFKKVFMPKKSTMEDLVEAIIKETSSARLKSLSNNETSWPPLSRQ